MSDTITYVESPSLSASALTALFRSAGLRRPVDDQERLEAMIRHANLVVAAYADGQLVGVARALTDFSYCCYLSDLAVAGSHQRRGIGRELVRRVRERIGDGAVLLLLSAPEAMDYYPLIGFEPITNGWMIRRTR